MEKPPKRPYPDALGEGPQDEPGGRLGLESLSRPISPPRKRQRVSIPSPWQLTWIRDLPEDQNRDALTLKDLLGDPLIAECWQFNYLHDIPFVMDAFDPDTRHLVDVHVVHGFWKRDDPNRLALIEQAAEFKNVRLHVAPMPEMFGTHHSKMMILFRHDESAQVIIHTANMIAKDWTNMTNGVWGSPRLPKLSSSTRPPTTQQETGNSIGQQFKADLLSYLSRYDSRGRVCYSLVEQLAQYDFSSIRATLVASVPGRHSTRDDSQTKWGWAALAKHLRSVDCAPGESNIAVQISSIATLGANGEWMKKTLFEPLSASKNAKGTRPKFKVVFPTPDEIRRSLDGYASGGSIHTKIQSAQQAKQLQYLRPIFHHWANDSPAGKDLGQDGGIVADGGRQRAAPHIKTYIRYNSNRTIDWAMLTSANLSKQAWGDAVQTSGEFRIASWEIGVLLWPQLFGEDVSMVGTFRTDSPDSDAGGTKTTIGLRIPYSLPLQQYGKDEVPWVATIAHAEPDRLGRTWDGW
ncbi:putative tyrosyl-DNA phosphodiesterase [Paramyrothecium foliicola]|nr:putative tyrosyl-DNA phosphodiesterase [Paramyrothecium foliicola]